MVAKVLTDIRDNNIAALNGQWPFMRLLVDIR